MSKIRIGVIGQSGPISKELYQLAYEVGKEIGKQGAILFSGGRDGVMEAVSRGAKTGGAITVGILPGDSISEGNEYLDVPITTGLSFDYRSNILIHSSDVIIMLGGGNGTLGELSMSYLNRKPAVVLENSGGWAERIREFVYDGHYLDRRANIRIEYALTPREAVLKAVELAR